MYYASKRKKTKKNPFLKDYEKIIFLQKQLLPNVLEKICTKTRKFSFWNHENKIYGDNCHSNFLQYFCITSVLIWQSIPDLFLIDLTDLFCLKSGEKYLDSNSTKIIV